VPPSKPEAIGHLLQARSDYGLYQELKQQGKYLDGVVTALFYTALHLAEAGLAEHYQRGGPKSHAQRDAAIYRDLRPIYEGNRSRSRPLDLQPRHTTCGSTMDEPSAPPRKIVWCAITGLSLFARGSGPPVLGFGSMRGALLLEIATRIWWPLEDDGRGPPGCLSPDL
jgi:hypothetical protein